MNNIPIDLFENYLENKRLSQKTITEYIYYFQKFHYSIFDQDSVNLFLSDKGNRNTVSRSFLKNLQKFLVQNYKTLKISQEERFDISEVEFPKVTGRKEKLITRPLQEKDILLLETFLKSESDKLKLLISFYSGLRCQELLTIRVISFNWPEWKINPQNYGECIVYGKGAKERKAIVPPFLMVRIRDYISSKFGNPNDYLFLKKNNSKYLDSSARLWRMNLADAGINAKLTQLTEKGKVIEETRVHPHRLRHSCANL